VPVSGSYRKLADLPDAGLFEDVRAGLWRETVTIMAAVLAVAAVMALLLFRYHARNKRLEYLYTHDATTGLPNRFYFLDRLQRHLHRGRQNGPSCALLLIDLGGFRVASNALLHQRNNRILMREVGDRIRLQLSESDVLAHLAGNEFALLLCGAAADTATRTAQAILETLKKPFTEDKSVTLPKAGIGIAIAPEHGEDPETLTQHATAALSAARLSTSGLAFYSPA
jgi:diguanylate cyclase (GGDEF)-like protein